MARDGLRKVGAIALAIGGLAGAAGLGSLSAGAAGRARAADEFEIPTSEYSIESTYSRAASAPTGPDFAFVDANNNGTFEAGTDARHDLYDPGARGRKRTVSIELGAAGFVIPPAVKSVTADDIAIYSDGGNVVVGEGVVVKASGSYEKEGLGNISIVGANVTVLDGAKVLANGEVTLDSTLAEGGTVALGDDVKVRAKGGIQDNAPAVMNIGARVSLMAPGSGIYLLDPDDEMRIGDGTKFVADTIEFGVGLSGDTPVNVLDIGDGVSFIAKEKLKIDSFGTSPVTYPASTTLKGRHIDLLAEDGALRLDAKVKAQTLSLRSNASVHVATNLTLSAQGTLKVSGLGAGVRTPLTIDTTKKLNVGKNGLLNLWTDSPVNTAKVKNADTVFVNGVGSGPRAMRVTLNFVNPAPASVVEMRLTHSGPVVKTCTATTNPCVGTFLYEGNAYIYTLGPKTSTTGGQCHQNPTHAVIVKILDHKTCTLTFN